MSSYFATEDRVAQIATAVAVAAGSTSTVFRVGKNADIKRVIVVMTAAQTGAGAVATFGIRNADGSTGSVTKGSFTIPVAAVNTVIAAEIAGVYPAPIVNAGEVSQPATVTTGRVLGYQTNLPGILKVNVGQQFWITIAAAGSGGTADIYIEYEEEGNAPTRYNPTLAAVTLV